MPNADTLYSTLEAAEYLRVSKATVLRWIQQGKLPASRFSRRNIVIMGSDLEAFVAGHAVDAPELAEGSSSPVAE